MFEIQVSSKKGKVLQKVHCAEEKCRIGRDRDNMIILQGRKVGAVHAWLVEKEEGVFIEDNSSKTGVIVNGSKVSSHGPILTDDSITIGDYQLKVICKRIQNNTEAGAPVVTEERTKDLVASTSTELMQGVVDNRNSKLDELYATWRIVVRDKLVKLLDLRRIDVNKLSESELRAVTGEIIDKIIADIDDLPTGINRAELARQSLAEAVGLGPLEELLADDSITEVMVNSADQLFFEQNGRLKKSHVTFTDDRAVISAIERIVAPLGRRIDESSPMVDARLTDGSRVNAIIPPLALKGPSITIRKFAKERLRAGNLIDFGSVSASMIDFIEMAVKSKRNVVISGGTGSGKTTLLNVLSNFIPESERIITVEDAAELSLIQPNLVGLEARPANQEGKGLVSIRDLVKNCLRMRPDRIVVGECRGGEALDMLQAMNTGHDGSLTTIHANSPRDCISRLEVLVMMSGIEMPLIAIREQVASAVNIIVQQTRFSCGSRKVTSITEVTGLEGNTVQLAEIFRFRQTGYGPDGKVQGVFEPTGLIPEFYEKLADQGAHVDLAIFEKRPATDTAMEYSHV
ncbi:MAG: ATPase, T2SS/T4P/T4SS family [Pseudomonadota bacterium]|nr:ATPase, T2SS/T4P/T4SS family [Pseudomonadota bacterium]